MAKHDPLNSAEKEGGQQEQAGEQIPAEEIKLSEEQTYSDIELSSPDVKDPEQEDDEQDHINQKDSVCLLGFSAENNAAYRQTIELVIKPVVIDGEP